MGMFDSVWFPCPSTGCDGTIEVQSKAGGCGLTDYNADDVPVEIAIDIAGESAWCRRCDRSFTVAKPFPDTTVMRLVGDGEDTCPHCGK